MTIVNADTGEIIEPLNPDERDHLTECETIIEAGLASFVEVGEALAQVRDSRLYRTEYATFEDYCAERWNLSRKRSYDLMAAAATVAALSPMGDTPANERQARPLAPLAKVDPQAAAEAWKDANETAEAEGRKVTAADVKQAVQAKVAERAPEPLAPGEADAIADAIGPDDDLDEVIEANAESKRTPNIPTKPDLGGGVSHPARYTDALVPEFAAILGELGGVTTVLDPFAGTGKVHQLTEWGYVTTGIEIEPEWAQMHERTITGSALAMPFDEHTFDAVVTSPTYGNRLADSHNASDPERRRSYTHDLGRPLNDDNSGAMQWGEQYRCFHQDAWNEVYRVLVPGGILLLNIKDHIRKGKRQEVPAWHLGYLLELGFTYRWHVDVAAPSLRAGTNSELRIDAETVFVLERDA